MCARLAADDCFRWRSRGWHLTYRGHVPPEELLALLSSVTSIRAVGTSIVHEHSNAEVPYDHTHMAWLWERAPNLHGARLFDIELELVHYQLHPAHMLPTSAGSAPAGTS